MIRTTGDMGVRKRKRESPPASNLNFAAADRGESGTQELGNHCGCCLRRVVPNFLISPFKNPNSARSGTAISCRIRPRFCRGKFRLRQRKGLEKRPRLARIAQSSVQAYSVGRAGLSQPSLKRGGRRARPTFGFRSLPCGQNWKTTQAAHSCS
jgi:hypothetical protein